MFVGVGEYLSLSGNPDSTRTIRFCLRGSGLQCVGLGCNNAYLPLRVFRNADRTQVTENSSSARTFLLHCRNGQICEAVSGHCTKIAPTKKSRLISLLSSCIP